MGVQGCVCICVCSYTPPPAGLCDHIPADTSFSSPVASAGVSPRQALFVRVLIGWEETGADSQRRQEEPSHNNSPHPPAPLRVTQNVILPPAAALAQPSRWKEQTFKTLWQVSQALPLSQCRWWSWDWQAPSHRSWLGDTPSSVRVTSHPRQGRIPGTSCMMGWADLCTRLMWAEDEEDVWHRSTLQGVSLFGLPVGEEAWPLPQSLVAAPRPAFPPPYFWTVEGNWRTCRRTQKLLCKPLRHLLTFPNCSKIVPNLALECS